MSAVAHRFEPSGASTSPRILVVDDNQPTARALATLLNGSSFETAVAFRGADAIERARASITGPGRFDAAIVDIHLPDINGLLVSQKLRELFGPDVPIIVLSGDTSMPLLNSLSHVGATYFFSKPVDTNQLLERLRELVGAESGSQK